MNIPTMYIECAGQASASRVTVAAVFVYECFLNIGAQALPACGCGTPERINEPVNIPAEMDGCVMLRDRVRQQQREYMENGSNTMPYYRSGKSRFTEYLKDNKARRSETSR